MTPDDRRALSLLLGAGAREPRATRFNHYVYMPDKGGAESCARKLQCDGFNAQCRMGADNVSWLVLATHDLVPDEGALQRVIDHLTEIAVSAGGEYDGWEAEVR